uniref:Glycosyltransferase 2-like domain-containing protein n=1 Tax=viral metagenome TaxID=1070528 RepID=A0A6C0B134_9ZZZZ
MKRVILSTKSEFKYFKEYINSFSGSDEVVLYDSNTPKFTENIYYLCVRRVPFELLPAECKIGFLNTEQLCIPSKLAEYNTYLRDDVEVFDYSQANITDKGTYLPYNEVASETEFLKTCIVPDKKFNIAVIGTPTPYRMKIIQEIQAAGYTVDFINEFDEPRDKRVGQCSVLLNLHADKEYTIYESVRCERWRFAGMPIITMPCYDGVPSGITVAKNLITTLEERLGKPKGLKLGLCMIVKNESHIIHEVLQATLPLIDTYCILDTGSSDNTVQIIKDFYAKTEITGEVVLSDWKGFDKSRTEALRLCDGKMDYILMIDADDLMMFPVDCKVFLHKVLEEHKPNGAIIQIKRGNIDYVRTQIFKADDAWRYVGVLHEYPTNDKTNNKMIKLPPEIYMIGRTLGSRSKQEGNKYLKDAEILLAEVEKEPENDRYVFYLAQSYRDGGNILEAIKWYKRRVEMGKWKEEQCVSAMNLARLLQDKDWAWRAHELNPKRNESLVWYASYCRAKNLFTHDLLAMIMYATTIPKPSENVLFVENDIYDWRMWDELAVIAYHMGRKDIAKQAGVRLLHDNLFPAEQRGRIENNLKAALS